MKLSADGRNDEGPDFQAVGSCDLGGELFVVVREMFRADARNGDRGERHSD